MGVKTAVAGITVSNAGKAQATKMGYDYAAELAKVQLACQEAINTINDFITNVLTPGGGDGSNITTLNTQVTNLS